MTGELNHRFNRACGVLLPIFSLPSRYGIGAVSRSAYEFVDFLAKAGQRYWQILPLGPTSYGDSPYQSFSTFAGNPYFIDIEALIARGLLSYADAEPFDIATSYTVDYELLYRSRSALIRNAFVASGLSAQSDHEPEPEFAAGFERFAEKNRGWLSDYACFMTIKNANGGRPWSEWDEELRLRYKGAIEGIKEKYKDEITFICFEQYLFYEQWMALKRYANEKGIYIIGDVPIYVAYDSADAWANPELFQFDHDGKPTAVAGCPPDAFARTGQLWGNPLYRWDYHARTGYAWWLRRIRHCFEMVDVLRIDHFRGFDEYYSIPSDMPTAEHGTWEKGPGIELFDVIRKNLGDRPIIAEDLGFVTQSVRSMVRASGYPGMKVIQFGFDSDSNNDYLPHNYDHESVVYTGTHDNDTIKGWFNGLKTREREFANRYVGRDPGCKECDPWDYIRLAMSSVADTAIIPMQDYLCLGSGSRINTPSRLGGNWGWRMDSDAMKDELAGRMRTLAGTYGRL